jgi:hypothetical protein
MTGGKWSRAVAFPQVAPSPISPAPRPFARPRAPLSATHADRVVYPVRPRFLSLATSLLHALSLRHSGT